MDVNWWAMALPSTITATSAFLAVLAGQWFTRRKDKREGSVTEFRWLISLVTSENTVARRMGEVLLKDAVDHPERRDKAAQEQIIKVWVARIDPEIPPYDEDDTIEIVDDEPEA